MNLAGRVAVATVALASALPVIEGCGRSSYRGTYDPSELHREAGVPMTQVGDREVAVFVKPQNRPIFEPSNYNPLNWENWDYAGLKIFIDNKCVYTSGYIYPRLDEDDPKYNERGLFPEIPRYIGPLEAGQHKVKVKLELTRNDSTRRKFVGRLDPKSDDLGFIEEKVPGKTTSIPEDRQEQYFTSAGGPTILEIRLGRAPQKSFWEREILLGYELEVFTSEPRVPKIKTETKIVGEDKSAHFCSNCGTQLAESAKFCSGCGTKR